MDTPKKLLMATVIEFIVIGMVMFLAAGTFAWPAGWAFLIGLFGLSIPLVLWLLKHSPGLVEERMALFRPNQPTWDKAFVVAVVVISILWMIVAPMDAVRFGWSHIPVWLRVAGGILALYAYYLFYLIYKQNPYLSATVRIQEERGQRVISTGPYRYVRHPLYAAAILFFIGSSLWLNSWYGVLLSLILGIILAARSIPEERLLRAELEGYDDYMAQVRYRLIPGIW